jgi:hypothetical protein
VKRISYRDFAIGVGAAGTLGVILRVLSGLNLVWCVVIALAAIVANGIIATVEDRDL